MRFDGDRLPEASLSHWMGSRRLNGYGINSPARAGNVRPRLRDRDRIFIADELVVVAVGLMREGFAGAPYRDAFAVIGPHNIDRLG